MLIKEAIQLGEAKVTEGVIRGVKLLGYESLNGRRYNRPDPSLYEGVKINLDHPGFFEAPSVRDTVGKAENVRVDENGVWGDISLNPKHPWTEALLWNIEHLPNKMGMSHVAYTEEVGEDDDGTPRLNVLQVVSVDVVGEPATTKGFFEGKQHNMDEKVKALEAELKAANAALAIAEQKLADEVKAHEATKAEQATRERIAARQKMLADAKIEAAPAFEKAVLSAESDQDAADLIADIVKTRKPVRSSEQDEGKPDTVDTLEAAKAKGLLNYE